MRHLLRLACPLCLIACALAASGAHAHPIVSTDVNRHVTLRVTDQRLEIRYIYELLEIAAINTARAWDADGDGKTSIAERDAYAAGLGEELRHAIRLRLDGNAVPLQLEGVRWELGEGAMGLATWKLYVRFSAYLPVAAGTGVLEYRDTLRPAEVGWKEIVLTAGGSTGVARADVPANDISYELTDYAAIADSPNPDRTAANAVLRFAGVAPSAPQPPVAATVESHARPEPAQAGRAWPAVPVRETPSEADRSTRTDAAARPDAVARANKPASAGNAAPAENAAPTPEKAQPDATGTAPPDTALAAPAQPPPTAGTLTSAWHHYAWPFFKLGVHHIATGYDHLLFLLGLLLLRQTLARLVAVVTAFTVAHSITLGLAAAGWIRPPGVWIELAIAASIAYVGLVALVRPRTAHGPWIALAFGLVHGFGFAGALGGALSSVAPGRSWLVALAGFNLGIEAFQLLVVVVLWPLLQRADRWAWAPVLRRAMALVVLAAGLAWVAARLPSVATAQQHADPIPASSDFGVCERPRRSAMPTAHASPFEEEAGRVMAPRVTSASRGCRPTWDRRPLPTAASCPRCA